jgi:hypothetical protein
VTEPSGYGGDIHAGFNALGRKEVPEIVVGDSGHAYHFCGPRHGWQTLFDKQNGVGWRFLRSFFA